MKRKHSLLLILPFLVFPIVGCNGDKEIDDIVQNDEDGIKEHNYSDAWTSNSSSHWHKCIDEGYENLIKDLSEHSFETSVVEPTYENGGYTLHTCSICGYFYKDNETSRLDHHYSSMWSFDENKHWHACIDEGYENLRIIEEEHNFGEMYVREDGKECKTCTICGYTYVGEMHVHTFSQTYEYDETHHWRSSTCGHDVKTDYGEHSYGDWHIINDTIEERECSVCGYKEQRAYSFNFSIGLESETFVAEVGKTDKIKIYSFNNIINTSFSYSSTDQSVATIDSNGNINYLSPGEVNFGVKIGNSSSEKFLKRPVTVIEQTPLATGGFNYSSGTSSLELEKRAEILGKLEKYAMDSHLTGITLFDNGGYVKYSDRVQIPTTGKQYIEGYGFGILSEGSLDSSKPLTGDGGGAIKPDYYHDAISQDSLTINQYSSVGSQVSDLAGYITSSFWSRRLMSTKSEYEWYPALAKDTVSAPIFDSDGNVTGYTAKAVNSEPIPAEVPNETGLYKKWRIYVKTDDEFSKGLKYTTNSSKLKGKGFDGLGVKLEDYEFIFKLLFTGSNMLIKGAELANDTTYGIKGAQRYFNETKFISEPALIDEKWEEYKLSGKLGIETGFDEINGSYIDIELINPTDSFTAMYTLSNSLFSPLPKSFFVGDKSIAGTMKESIKKYGSFNYEGDDAILDYTLCLGAYTLEKWTKNAEIAFKRNDGWFETEAKGGFRYKIPGVYYRVIDTSTDTEKNWKQLEAGNLDCAKVPSSKLEENIGKPNVYQTKGDSTFKLNVNSCSQEQWDKFFGKDGTICPNSNWNVKPWMSNNEFLDGLFYSIDRESFAKKRGVTPSVNYFSDAYQMRNGDGGYSYNSTQAHKEAVKGYSENYGYNLDKAIDCFRNAVYQLSQQGKLVLGSKDNPTEINIHIRWMYQTDIKEYGNEIKSYFERAFNDDAVCGGKVKLVVLQDAVTNWEEVYNEYMMKGQFDLGFGAISGNTYNPLNFMEVLKSDNSSSFTLNWGTDTSKVDEKNPIVYDGKKWSFDALWEVADHGGIVENGEITKRLKCCYANMPTKLEGSAAEPNLYNGFNLELFIEFNEVDNVSYDINRVDCYVYGRGNITLGDKAGDYHLVYDKVNHVIRITVSYELAQEIQDAIVEANGFKPDDIEEWHQNPFIMQQYMRLFCWEVYYELSIGGDRTTVCYAEVNH